MFRRAQGMLPLSEPIKGGNLTELRNLVNIPGDTDFDCYVACLVGALRPQGPYPVLEIKGEYGSAKSSAQKYWRNLIDPNTAPLRRPPREPRDLAIAANNSWVVSLNNLSYLPDWLSDDLCCVSTGLGFAVRSLYSDMDETIFTFQRPVVINGIEDVIARGDLADRRLSLCLPAIAPGAYQTEKELDRKFAKAAPGILGRLLDIVSVALKNLPTTKVAKLPRMADFVTWIEAAAPALGWEPEAFAEIYRTKVALGNAAVLEVPVAEAIQKLHLPFKGPASELLIELTGLVAEKVTRQKAWPKNGGWLSNRLRLLAPDLRRVGIQVVFDDKARPRQLVIQRFFPSGEPTRSEDNGKIASVASEREKSEEIQRVFSDAIPDATPDDSVGERRSPVEIPPTDANPTLSDAACDDSVGEKPQHFQGSDATDATDATDAADAIYRPLLDQVQEKKDAIPRPIANRTPRLMVQLPDGTYVTEEEVAEIDRLSRMDTDKERF
jgi:hypothetical protein